MSSSLLEKPFSPEIAINKDARAAHSNLESAQVHFRDDPDLCLPDPVLPRATDSLLLEPSSYSVDDIARRAYQLWENRSCPLDGSALEDWLQAENEFRRAGSY